MLLNCGLELRPLEYLEVIKGCESLLPPVVLLHGDGQLPPGEEQHEADDEEGEPGGSEGGKGSW